MCWLSKKITGFIYLSNVLTKLKTYRKKYTKQESHEMRFMKMKRDGALFSALELTKVVRRVIYYRGGGGGVNRYPYCH